MKGYPAQSATFDRKTDAKVWASRIETELRAGRHLGPRGVKRRTVGDMIDRCMVEVMPSKKQNSKTSQIPQLHWWKEQLGHLTLSNSSPALIAEKRDKLLATETRYGRPRSPSTVVRYLAVLSHCFTMAVKEWGWLELNPVRNVSRPKESRGRVRILSESERSRLLDSCRESRKPHLYAVVVLALSTGMLRGEILGLSWDRVDFERQAIVLMPEHTKNSEVRVLPLVGYAYEVLRGQKEWSSSESSLVSPAPSDRNGPNKPIKINTAGGNAVEEPKLRTSDSTISDIQPRLTWP